MTIRLETHDPPVQCDATRGKRSTVHCELPAEHADRWHFGRSRTGRWFSWAVASREQTR